MMKKSRDKPRDLLPQTEEEEIGLKIGIIRQTIAYLERCDGKISNYKEMIRREEEKLETLKKEYPEFFV